VLVQCRIEASECIVIPLFRDGVRLERCKQYEPPEGVIRWRHLNTGIGPVRQIAGRGCEKGGYDADND
jgi:hypothetical protein